MRAIPTVFVDESYSGAVFVGFFIPRGRPPTFQALYVRCDLVERNGFREIGPEVLIVSPIVDGEALVDFRMRVFGTFRLYNIQILKDAEDVFLKTARVMSSDKDGRFSSHSGMRSRKVPRNQLPLINEAVESEAFRTVFAMTKTVDLKLKTLDAETLESTEKIRRKIPHLHGRNVELASEAQGVVWGKSHLMKSVADGSILSMDQSSPGWQRWQAHVTERRELVRGMLARVLESCGTESTA